MHPSVESYSIPSSLMHHTGGNRTRYGLPAKAPDSRRKADMSHSASRRSVWFQSSIVQYSTGARKNVKKTENLSVENRTIIISSEDSAEPSGQSRIRDMPTRVWHGCQPSARREVRLGNLPQQKIGLLYREILQIASRYQHANENQRADPCFTQNAQRRTINIAR